MPFSKKHKITFKKPIIILRDDLKSPNNIIQLQQINDSILEGYIDFRYGYGGSIISTVNLEELNRHETIVTIKNRFDFLMHIYVLILCSVLWGFAIYELMNEAKIGSFEVLIKSIFPLIIIVMIKFTLHFYDKRIIKTYEALVKNNAPR